MADGGAGRGDMEWGTYLKVMFSITVIMIWAVVIGVHFGWIQ